MSEIHTNITMMPIKKIISYGNFLLNSINDILSDLIE